MWSGSHWPLESRSSEYLSTTESFSRTEHPGPAKETIWRSNVVETAGDLRRRQQGGKSVVTDGSVHAAVSRRVFH